MSFDEALTSRKDGIFGSTIEMAPEDEGLRVCCCDDNLRSSFEYDIQYATRQVPSGWLVSQASKWWQVGGKYLAWLGLWIQHFMVFRSRKGGQ